jgi:cystathionine beta-lyase
VTIVSDEIHCDFVWAKHPHTSFGRLNENAIIATAPSKTFNLAGLQVSNLFVRNADLRDRLKAEISKSGYGQLNTLGLVACQSAYTKGKAWLEALRAYLFENIRITREFLAARLPKIKLTEPEGTYLLWLDFPDTGLPRMNWIGALLKAQSCGSPAALHLARMVRGFSGSTLPVRARY